MTIKISDEELSRLRQRLPIAADDTSAVSTKPGWDRFQAESKTHREAKEADVPNGRIYIATRAGDLRTYFANPGLIRTKDVIAIECERFVDARSFARMHFASEVDVSPPQSGEKPAKRWQVKWSGSGMDPRNALHMIAREIGGTGHQPPWRPARDA